MSKKLDFYYSAKHDAHLAGFSGMITPPSKNTFKGQPYTQCQCAGTKLETNFNDYVYVGTGTDDDIEYGTYSKTPLMFVDQQIREYNSTQNHASSSNLFPDSIPRPTFDLRKHFLTIIDKKQPGHVLDTDFVIVQFYCEERDKTSFVGGLASEADWSLGKMYAVVMVAI